MEGPVVEFSDGKVQGIVTENFDGDKIYSFLGIPYGKPPTGDKRFKAPEPIDKWEGVRDCTKDGEKNIQIQPLINLALEGSEDCLHLNVFTKEISVQSSKLKPVMVYLFGGRFRSGSNKSDLFGPEYLLTEDIVLVTPNFRVGLLGFLSLEDPSLDIQGNAGLKDQNLALQWVQKNIKEFGGNSNNVTLVGHSTGAVSAHYHVLSQRSHDLFHKAIIMSGSVFWTWTEPGKFSLKLFAKILNIEEYSEKEILKHLQALSTKELILAQEKYCNVYEEGRSVNIGPVVETPNITSIITSDPMSMLLNGDFMKIPLLMTYTSHEGLMYDMVDKYCLEQGLNFSEYSIEPKNLIPTNMKLNIDDVNLKAIYSEMEKTYNCANNSTDRKRLMMSDLHFIVQLRAAAMAHAEFSDKPVYLMRWSMDDEMNFMKAACKSLDIAGTSHADELGYIFSRDQIPRPKVGSNPEKILRRAVHLLRNFCHSGNPSLCSDANVSKWKPIQSDRKVIIDFGNEVELKRCPELERMETWHKVLQFNKRKNTKMIALTLL